MISTLVLSEMAKILVISYLVSTNLYNALNFNETGSKSRKMSCSPLLSDITNIMSVPNDGRSSGMRLDRAINIPCATPNEGYTKSTFCKIWISCYILEVELEVLCIIHRNPCLIQAGFIQHLLPIWLTFRFCKMSTPMVP